jgi:hypothetical protein
MSPVQPVPPQASNTRDFRMGQRGTENREDQARSYREDHANTLADTD